MHYPEKQNSLDLTFKIPSDKDGHIKAEYRPLTPENYMEFIKLSLELLPDRKYFIDRKKKITPVGHKFKLS